MADDISSFFPTIKQQKPAGDMGSFFPTIETKPSMSLGEMTGKAISNIPSSAVQFGKDIAQPFLHPIDTAVNLKNLGLGVLEATGMKEGAEHSPYLEAIGQHFKDRYGGWENIKKTIASDPVGTLGDVSMLLMGPEMAAARAPGVIGQTARTLGSVGRAVNPLNVPGKLARGTGEVLAQSAGLMSGAGRDAVRTAARAGYEGGETAQAFRESMRGQVPMEQVVQEARAGVEQLKKQRGSDYRAAMAKSIKPDKTILSWNDVDRALIEMDDVARYKGVSLSPSTAKVRAQIHDVIGHWQNLKASDYWTVEGFDALKKRIGDIRDTTAPGTPERLVANRAYGAIRDTISKQAPIYNKIMQGYEKASVQIRELEKALSLSEGASIDTSLRKLQSVLRNDVNSAYGYRRKLTEFLLENGSPNLIDRLAGQALNPWTGRGFAKLGQQLDLAFLLKAVAKGVGGGALSAGAALPMMSPRLVGESAYYAGRMASPAMYLPTRSALLSGEVGKTEREMVRRKRPHITITPSPEYGGPQE